MERIKVRRIRKNRWEIYQHSKIAAKLLPMESGVGIVYKVTCFLGRGAGSGVFQGVGVLVSNGGVDPVSCP